MTKDEYRTAIAALGWSQVRAAHELGVTPRQSQRYASGENKIPKPLELLLRERMRGEK